MILCKTDPLTAPSGFPNVNLFSLSTWNHCPVVVVVVVVIFIIVVVVVIFIIIQKIFKRMILESPFHYTGVGMSILTFHLCIEQ